jgi:hypothetical protein
MKDIFGTVPLPSPLAKFGDVGTGLGVFLNLILKVLIVGAALYALFNLVLAGYSFMSASDEPKKMEQAWAKIWQTLVGLAFAAGAYVLAAIFGQIIFKDPYFILRPTIPTP